MGITNTMLREQAIYRYSEIKFIYSLIWWWRLAVISRYGYWNIISSLLRRLKPLFLLEIVYSTRLQTFDRMEIRKSDPRPPNLDPTTLHQHRCLRGFWCKCHVQYMLLSLLCAWDLVIKIRFEKRIFIRSTIEYNYVDTLILELG